VRAKLFVEHGAQVMLAARREDLVREAAADRGSNAAAMRADVTVEDDGQDLPVWGQTLEH
jgi:NADP-dependent 3-hydroxy acid dehydrogenase YdfG